jgi:hypothetical protein
LKTDIDHPDTNTEQENLSDLCQSKDTKSQTHPENTRGPNAVKTEPECTEKTQEESHPIIQLLGSHNKGCLTSLVMPGLVIPRPQQQEVGESRNTRTLAARSVEALTNHMVTSIIKEVTRGGNGDKAPVEKDSVQTEEEIK